MPYSFTAAEGSGGAHACDGQQGTVSVTTVTGTDTANARDVKTDVAFLLGCGTTLPAWTGHAHTQRRVPS